MDTLNNWYSITPCQYPEGQWRCTQVKLLDYDADIDEADMSKTTVAEGSLSGLISTFRGKLDLFIEGHDPIFCS